MDDLNVTITPAADKFVRRMLRFDGGPNSGLRLSVAPGGCSGLSAEFAVVDKPTASETVHETNGLRFFIDAQSKVLLQGVTMDFVETPTSAGLKFHDPKAVSTCGSHSAPSLDLHDHKH
ncbi:HesB/IscA family protein [Beijerinckia indica]|uniref:Iron-sulfur cluster assembly accessory protein n=1 Tax=Beijerinckia indica subsp. indica (strain ATCC 9039 / DSM 1715 / NCIMB 8712) TaxID=395963 RepID=B2IE27_BEII9|nr:iron-sulfur cluster assembly accessory protein [Beijerinckia indica]ACB94051.1 iron-sulfur cluster assembly accessory protein [Beijerinckia indica subsp. indica ATCC 9039]